MKNVEIYLRKKKLRENGQSLLFFIEQVYQGKYLEQKRKLYFPVKLLLMMMVFLSLPKIILMRHNSDLESDGMLSIREAKLS